MSEGKGMTTKTTVQITKPPIGLIPHKFWMQTRQVDIQQAIKRFEDTDNAIPECWREELEALKLEIEAEK